MNLLFLGQFKLIYLFVYWVYHSKKNHEIWPSVCDSAWFWDAYYSARLCYLRCSFMAWRFYCWLDFKVLGRDRGYVDTRLSIFRAQRIVFLRFSILNKDQGLFYRKCNNDIRNWAQKVCGQCWRSWPCCRQTLPLVRAIPNHSTQSLQKLKDKLPLYYSISQSSRPSAVRKRWIASAWCLGNSIAMSRILRWKTTPGRRQLSLEDRGVSLARWWWLWQVPGRW